MQAGGNDALNNFLEAYGESRVADIRSKYNTWAAELYRDKIRAAAEGRPWEAPPPGSKPPERFSNPPLPQQGLGGGSGGGYRPALGDSGGGGGGGGGGIRRRGGERRGGEQQWRAPRHRRKARDFVSYGSTTGSWFQSRV